MKTKHLVLSIAAIVMLLLIIVFAITSSFTASAKGKGNTLLPSEPQAYPVTLPTLSLVGLSGTYDGTVDGRRNTLANLWKSFGTIRSLNNDPAIYRRKIYVVFLNNGEQKKEYSIFIGYSVINWLRSEITHNNGSLLIMDIPKANYYGYDVRGTSINSIIKGWADLYSMYPSTTSNRAMEVYNLDADDYAVENVTLYLKK